MSDLLEVKDLKKYFPIYRGIFRRQAGNVRAVDGISFRIREGETLGLVGESGSGKSTAAWSMIRLIEPTGGSVFFQGKDILQYKSKELRQFRMKVQMVFQDPYSSLNPRKTILENVGGALLYHRLVESRRQQIDRVASVMEHVGLPADILSKYPHQFSGGQQQRISIGRSIILNPKLIICDEAVSALDISVRGQILNLLQELKQKLNLSYLFIAHDLNLVKSFCKRILVMYRGQIVESGPSRLVFEKAKHPYTQILLSSIPKQHPKEKKERIYPRNVSTETTFLGCPFFGRCPVSKSICALVPPPLKMDAATGHKYRCIH